MEVKKVSAINAETFLNKVKLLSCPVCLDIAINVKELPCRHAFCETCWEQYREGKAVSLCPLCKKEVPKRKILKQDAALNNLCIFVKELRDDFQKYYKIDISSYLVSLNNSASIQKSTETSESLPTLKQNIQQSSEDNDVIPCTSNTIKNKYPNKKALKKSIDVKRKSATRDKLDVKKQIPVCNTPISSSRNQCIAVGRNQPRKPNTKDIINNANKIKILQWLQDTRNKFESLSQTQSTYDKKNTQDTNMPSISQICYKKDINLQREQRKVQGLLKRKTRSVENLQQNESGKLKRHSLDSGSLSSQHKEINEVVENKLVIDIIENEVLDAFDKDFSENQTKIETFSKRDRNIANSSKANLKIKTYEESEQSSQLYHEIPEKKMTTPCDILNNKKKKVSKSWKSINTLKKNIGKAKARKKLDISVQITQKQTKNKSLQELNLNSTALNKNTESVQIQNKEIDFEKIKHTNIIPEILASNKSRSSQPTSKKIRILTNLPDLSTAQENCSNKCEEVMETEMSLPNKEESENSGSDIYVFQTQPLTKGFEYNKVDQAIDVAKKLKNLLSALEKENRPASESVYQTIRDVFEIRNSVKTLSEKKCQTEYFNLKSNKQNFSEKEIQTDYFTSDGFNISSTAAFKSLNYEDATTQTDSFCKDCPHVGQTQLDSYPRSHKISTQIERRKTISESDNFELESSIKNVEEYVSLTDKKTLILDQVSSKKQNNSFQNIQEGCSKPTVPYESEIPLEDIMKLCNTETAINAKSKLSETSIFIENLETSNVEEVVKDREPLVLRKSTQKDSQSSAIICTLPSIKSSPKNKLLLETVRQLNDLRNLKRARTEESNCDFDNEKPVKIRCDRFKDTEFSIHFETESIDEQFSIIPKNKEESRSQSVSYIQSEHVQEKYTTKTQDIMKHCDEIIEKANQQICNENIENIKGNKSQVPGPFLLQNTVEYFQSGEAKSSLTTQELLDHCDALIDKNTKDIGKESNAQEDANLIEIDSDTDDELLCQNLDRLDNLIQEENKRKRDRNIEFSGSSGANKENKSYSVTPKSTKFTGTHSGKNNSENVTVLQNVTLRNKEQKTSKEDGSSDDEMFSDMDIVETTPQKSKASYGIERLSDVAALPSSRMSLKFLEVNENSPEDDIVPPPPEFGDKDKKSYNDQYDFEYIRPLTQKESESVIPNSLSPNQINMEFPKHPANTRNLNSEEFMNISPIRSDKMKPANIMDMVRQSKLSPLTIVPKAPTVLSSLTSTPKQKSILNYVKESTQLSQSKSVQNTSQSSPLKRKPCIAFSRLDVAENLYIQNLVTKNLATCRDKVGPQVTHLIVSVNKNNCVKDHTIKYVHAVAAGLWILNVNWIQKSLAHNAIVDEEPFEVLDKSGIPGPRISRLSRLKDPLFEGFRFYLHGTFTQTSEEDIENVIELLSGSTVKSIEDFQGEDNVTCVIVSEGSCTEDSSLYDNWLETYKIVTVHVSWIVLSVARYKVVSFKPHLLCSEYCLDELGYQGHLLVDVPPSLLTQE